MIDDFPKSAFTYTHKLNDDIWFGKNPILKVLAKANIEILNGKTFTIPNEVNVIHNNAFEFLKNCTIFIDSTFLIIEDYAFLRAENVTIHLTDGCYCIIKKAFANSCGITLYLPTSKKSNHIEIYEDAFAYSDKINIYNLNYCHKIEPGCFDQAHEINIHIEEGNNSYKFVNNTLIYCGTILYCGAKTIELRDYDRIKKIAKHSLSDDIHLMVLLCNNIILDEKACFSDDYLGGTILTTNPKINSRSGPISIYNLESTRPDLLSRFSYGSDYVDDDAYHWIKENYIYIDPQNDCVYNKTMTRLLGRKKFIEDVKEIYAVKKLVSYDIGEGDVFTVPNSVKTICTHALANWMSLEKIFLPNNLISIGKYAFANCCSLRHIEIPEGVEEILACCFYNCVSLTSIILPKSLRYIDMNAFYNCVNLRKIIFQSNCELVNVDFYSDFSKITHLRMPKKYINKFHNRELIKISRLEIFDEKNFYPYDKYYLFLDTETTGLPPRFSRPGSDDYPRLVQLAYIIADERGNEVLRVNHIIKPDNFTIPFKSELIHGITTEYAQQKGTPLTTVLVDFLSDLNYCSFIVGHNVIYDIQIIQSELIKSGFNFDLKSNKPIMDTMTMSTEFCNLETESGMLKYPTLQELYNKLFHTSYYGTHNAFNDIEATKKCFYKLEELGIIPCVSQRFCALPNEND